MLARMWRKRNTPPFLVELQAYSSTLEISLEFLRILDIVLPEDLVIPLLGIYPEGVPTHNKETCFTMLIAAFS